MPVTRRTLLLSAGSCLSTLATGCLEAGRLLSGEQPERQVTLTDVDEVGAEHPFRFRVTLPSRMMGPDVTPKLSVTLENTGESDRFFGYFGSWPAGGLLPTRDSVPAGLRLLAEREAASFTIESGDCPRTEYHPETEESMAGHRIGAGRQFQGRYVIIGSAGELDGECPPPVRYRVRSVYAYASADDVGESGWENAHRHRFTWGFALELEDTESD